jgi:hypothetical protein
LAATITDAVSGVRHSQVDVDDLPQLTDITGTVVAETRYLPYGEERWITGTLVTDFTFTGQRAEAGFRLMECEASP